MLGGCGVFGVCGEVGLGSSTSGGRGLIVGPLVWSVGCVRAVLYSC